MKYSLVGTALAALIWIAGCDAAPASQQPAAADTAHAAAPEIRADSAQSGAPAQTAAAHPQKVPRISPEEARKKVQDGGALLVCAYDDRDKCDKQKLEGSIPYADLVAQLPELDRQRDIILFCA